MTGGGLERKLLLGIAGLFLLPTVIVEAALIVLYRAGVFRDALVLLVAVLVGLAALMAYLAWVAHSLGRVLVGALETIRHGAELMATVNPDHRIDIRSGDELEALARDVNGLADHARDARLELETRITRATHAVEAERAKLAAVLSDLAEGVVVGTLEGRVSLANRAAQERLANGSGMLGRSLFEFIDPHLVAPRLERTGGGSGTPERFTLVLPDGSHAAASMTAFLDGEGQVRGFILTFRDASGASEGSDPRPVEAKAVSLLSGAGLRSGVAGDTPSPPRTDLYDFSLLFDAGSPLDAAELERPLDATVFVVFDVETTGLSPESGDRVVSLAGVRVRAGVVRTGEIFDALVHPERPIPPASTRFHGITDGMVAGAPPIAVVLPAFIRFAEGAALAGHEVSFDLAFLGRDAGRLGLAPLASSHRVLDTRVLSRLVHGRSADHSLEALARRLGVTIRGRHSALGDALATAEVLVRLLDLLGRRGIRTIGQIFAAVRKAR